MRAIKYREYVDMGVKGDFDNDGVFLSFHPQFSALAFVEIPGGYIKVVPIEDIKFVEPSLPEQE